MRALIVGLGSIGRRHARNWAALRLGPLAICRQTNRTQPEGLGVDAAIYHDLEEALEREQPDIVIVTNPSRFHIDTANAAIGAGADVLIEKPLGDSTRGVAELLNRADWLERKLMVGYNLRFHPGLARLKQLVQQNVIGRVVSSRAEVGEYLPDWHPWENYRQSYSGSRQLGGGAVLTFSHELDALCWLLGPPKTITALTAHASSLEIDTEDVAEIGLEFETGAIGWVHVDYVRRAPRRCIELVGEAGILRWEYAEHRIVQYAAANRQWRVEEGDPRFERNQMYLDELRHFAACVRGEVERPLIDGEQGAAILALCLAALQSADEGHAVNLQHAPDQVKQWLSTLGKPLK